jgi:hypothetical protein
MGDRGQAGRASGWRTGLRREVCVLLLFKAAALALLWWLFFSPPHRTPVDASVTSRRLALQPPAGAGQNPITSAARTGDRR